MTRTAVLVTEGVRKAERFPVSRKRKPGLPAHRPAGVNRLTANEKDYAEAILAVLAAVPRNVIREQFNQPVGGPAGQVIVERFERVQPFLGELTLWQLNESGAAMFNEIKREVAAEWKTLEKATPSQTAMTLRFDRASPNATAYASMSSANMVRDMADTQIRAVRSVVATAFNEGVTRPQTSRALYQLLGKMPTPKGAVVGNYAVGQIFGDATRGLTVRYADAVVNRATKIMAQSPNLSTAQLKKRVDAYGNRLRRARARTIARTEMMRASNQGRLQGMWQAADQGLINPVLAKKQWVTSSFDVCKICVPLNGQTVGLRETFGNHGQAPPAHPNCRCVVRELPDPLTYGTPTSVGTGMTGSPMQFIRPSKPGLKIEDLALSPGVVAQPGAVVGQPGARGALIGDDIDLPKPVAAEPVVPDIDLPLPKQPTGRVEAMQSGEYFEDSAERLVNEANAIGKRKATDWESAKFGDDGKAWQYGEGSDYGMSVIAREQGFDGLPKIVSESQMTDLKWAEMIPEMDQANSKIFYRGIGADTAAELDHYVDDFLMNSDLPYQGRGIYGNGTYVTDSFEIASDYSQAKLGIATRGGDPSSKDWAHSKVLKMALDPDAKVVDSEDVAIWASELDNKYRGVIAARDSDLERIIKRYETESGVTLHGREYGGEGFATLVKRLGDVDGEYGPARAKINKLVQDGKVRTTTDLRSMTQDEIDAIFNDDVIGFRLNADNTIPFPEEAATPEQAKLIEKVFSRQSAIEGRDTEVLYGERIGWFNDDLGKKIPDSIDAPSGFGNYDKVLKARDEAKAQQALLSDPGRVAASQGYDAIRVATPNPTGFHELDDEYWVILNRTALSVLDPKEIVI